MVALLFLVLFVSLLFFVFVLLLLFFFMLLLRLSSRLSRCCCWLLLFASSMFFSCPVLRAWLRLPTPATTGSLLLAPCRAAMTTWAHAPLLVSFVSCVWATAAEGPLSLSARRGREKLMVAQARRRPPAVSGSSFDFVWSVREEL